MDIIKAPLSENKPRLVFPCQLFLFLKVALYGIKGMWLDPVKSPQISTCFFILFLKLYGLLHIFITSCHNILRFNSHYDILDLTVALLFLIKSDKKP